MLCYDFFFIRKVMSQLYSRFPGNRSTLRVCFGLDTIKSCIVRFGRPFTQSLSNTKFLRSALIASSEMREIHLGCFHKPDFLAPFQACHRLHLLLMSGCQRNQIDFLWPNSEQNLFRKAHECSSNPAGLQDPNATRNTCPIHLYYN